MQILIQRLLDYYTANNLVSSEDIPWLRYGLEKRISTIIVAIPFFLLAFLLSDATTAICFFASFYIIRRYTNGHHAGTLKSCFLQSLLYEALFLGVLCPLLSTLTAVILATVCTILIISLSPFNHPNMHLSNDEIKACRKCARFNATIIWGCAIVSAFFKNAGWLKGISSGIAMAAFLLCLAYFTNGGINNEQHARKNQKCRK